MQAPTHPSLRRDYVALIGQFLLCAAAAGVLLGVAPRVASAASDVVFVWLLAIVLHARASLQFVDQAVAYLHLDCPHCHESVHGFPEHLPRISRQSCANCGADCDATRLSEQRGADCD